MEEFSAWLEMVASGQGGMASIALFGAVFVISGIWSIRARRELEEDPETHMANDRLIDKRRTWVQGASLILMRLSDNAYLEEELIRTMLDESWGLSDKQGLDEQVARLLENEQDAWGYMRALLLLRSAVAVGWLSNEASFARCFEVGKLVQQRYPSWEALAEDTLKRRRAWRGLPVDGSGDDEDMDEFGIVLAHLRKNQWRSTPWGLDLSKA